MSNTANIVGMLYKEGVTGPKADEIAYEMLLQHSPGLVATVGRLVRSGRTPDSIGKDFRETMRRAKHKPDEPHIANCMAVARHLLRQRS